MKAQKKKQAKVWKVVNTISLLLLSASSLTLSVYAQLTNGMEADVVIGQPDFNSGVQNNGGVSAKSLNTPIGGESYDGKIYL